MKYMKLGTMPDTFQSDGNNIRFAATELETDIIVSVGDAKFYLHKFPLLSKSLLLQRLIASTEKESSNKIDIPDFPGGPTAFAICAKFCYGMIVTLNAYNVVIARCAAEHLEMLETVMKGNLIYKIDIFLNSSIFRSWKDSIIMLQSTTILQTQSEVLKIVSCCIDSIASKASIDPADVEWSYSYNRKKLPSENNLDPHWNGVMKVQSVPKDWWVEDLCDLDIDVYKRVINAIKSKVGVSGKVVGESLKAYVSRKLPDYSKSMTYGDDSKYRTLLENIVWLLPTDSGSASCSFLMNLLKAASFFKCGENFKKELIKKISYQLQDASVADLLIPAPDGDIRLYDVDTVHSIMEEFCMREHCSSQSSPKTSNELHKIISPASGSSSSEVAVAYLIDGYLTQVAKDPNLLLSKFVELADMVSESSRLSHDGFYSAMDMFLKEHPDLTKTEKKKICSLLDCSKLSQDTCFHAAQNDRLPLRVVVQVLYFENLRQFAASRRDKTRRDQSLASKDNNTQDCEAQVQG